MYTQVERSNKNRRAIATSAIQKRNGIKQRFGFVNNGLGSVAQKNIDEAPINCTQTIMTAKSRAIESRSQDVIQRLSHEYYDRAEIRYSDRAFAHMDQERVDQYLWDNQSQIRVGQNQTILVGDGQQTGYAVYGNISYNCTYDEDLGRHIIYVYHAHDTGRMG
ncbi:hypothetical protein [Marinomonas mediterranea]|uniref:Uncharacterized protein n=1 Tax=Marinomonas mediterranea (strain ATCC 700492 / JCM 21426 / NBRC 103028 / MMB-1) TaxID=717774 RepID=F2JY88_MARM1|nr:hypothetical protein [Marinomonas mediterranea]ADZ91919.1 hypothetical protein Marme_2688 [Marinomonas mediterranea MMB-1]WCN09869.1 hypothetical protein GV055_13555 [Marinomonas mediterranea]WCN18005.1 hypothetical protein GV053_13595 [Marinomonas mediterranea MMB-1]